MASQAGTGDELERRNRPAREAVLLRLYPALCRDIEEGHRAMPLQLDAWQWATLILGAFMIGLSKTGVVGLSTFAVALFALVLPARESAGVVLVILISADVVAVIAYRRHAIWSHLIRLFPWAALGVLLGFLAVGRISDRHVARLIGAILVVLVVLQWWRQQQGRRNPEAQHTPTSPWFAVSVGIIAGFTTMVANAAGPIMMLYMLAMRLPKMEFLGTAAWYFFVLNLFKVPFSYGLGLINPVSLGIDLRLAPVAMIGALSGRAIIRYVNQSLFETLALLFTMLAALRLLW